MNGQTDNERTDNGWPDGWPENMTTGGGGITDCYYKHPRSYSTLLTAQLYKQDDLQTSKLGQTLMKKMKI